TSSALLALASGSFDFYGGEITTDNLILTNSGGKFSFHGGKLHTKNSTFFNGGAFFVGDGTNAAPLGFVGGTHGFPDGLIISSNATLTGCGTIIGPITNHGTIATNCGGITMAPTIAEQPISRTVTQGATVSFRVIANGDAPLTYQWRFSGL